MNRLRTYELRVHMLRAGMQLMLFLFITLFMCNNFLPEYFSDLDAELIELTINGEQESEEEERENEEVNNTDHFIQFQTGYSFYSTRHDLITTISAKKWHNPYFAVVTPPPEAV